MWCDFSFCLIQRWRGKNRKLPYSSYTQKCLSFETALYRFYLSKDKLFSCLCCTAKRTFSTLCLSAYSRYKFLLLSFSIYLLRGCELLSFASIFVIILHIDKLSTEWRETGTMRYVNNSIIKKVGKPWYGLKRGGGAKEGILNDETEDFLLFLCVNKSLICTIIDLKRPKKFFYSRFHGKE